MFPTALNLLRVCNLNFDLLNEVDQVFISANEPLVVSPTNKFDEDK